MFLCPECGNYSEDSDSFCPHCGRRFTSADHLNTPVPERVSNRGSLFFPLIVLAVCIMVTLPGMMGIVQPPMEPEFDGHRELTWTVPLILDGEESVSFHISYEINENDLKSANASPLNRFGSSIDVRLDDFYPVQSYVVIGSTITDICQKLWIEYSNFVQLNPTHNNSIDFVNYIMAFVQNVMNYETDVKQFGQDEYWQFPVETLFHGHGDCEDGALLLAAIFKEMSNLNEIGDKEFAPGDYISDSAVLLLPNHAMAGICFETYPLGMENKFYSLKNGNAYWFCETTAKGYVVGDLITKYSLTSVKTFPAERITVYE